jgi:hypothetical protein
MSNLWASSDGTSAALSVTTLILPMTFTTLRHYCGAGGTGHQESKSP